MIGKKHNNNVNIIIMTIMGIVIPSQIEKKELDKNAKKIKRKKGQ